MCLLERLYVRRHSFKRHYTIYTRLANVFIVFETVHEKTLDKHFRVYRELRCFIVSLPTINIRLARIIDLSQVGSRIKSYLEPATSSWLVLQFGAFSYTRVPLGPALPRASTIIFVKAQCGGEVVAVVSSQCATLDLWPSPLHGLPGWIFPRQSIYAFQAQKTHVRFCEKTMHVR